MIYVITTLCVLVISNVKIYAQQDTLKPLIWYKADNLKNTSTYLHDYSNNGHNAYCSKGFTLNDGLFINYNKAIQFKKKSGDFRTNYIPADNHQMTILTVYQSTNPIGSQQIWTISFDSYLYAGLTTMKLKTLFSEKQYNDSTKVDAMINSTTTCWVNQLTDSVKNYISIGNKDSINMEGKFAEFILFNGVLDSLQALKIHTYLALKYGVSLIRSSYINSKDEVIWNYMENKDYSHEIAGIGYDLLSGINQKQSAADGGDNLLTIGAGKIEKSNALNPYKINQGDFLVWSSNNTKIENEAPVDSISNVLYPINHLSAKRWVMQVSGTTAKNISTEMILKADSAQPLKKCYLVIDRTGAGDFSTLNSDIIEATIDNEGKIATFSNIQWDTDNSGKDMFTFIYGDKLTLLATAEKYDSLESGKIKLTTLAGSPPFNYSLKKLDNPHIIEWTSSKRNHIKDSMAVGTYLAKVIDSKGKEDFKMVEIHKNNRINNTQISENTNTTPEQISVSEIKIIDIYPNPTKKEYHINVRLEKSFPIKLRILDFMGRIIRDEVFENASTYDINGNIESQGVYYVEINVNGNKKTTKLLVIE